MNKLSVSESQQLESLTGHRLGPYLSFNPVSSTQIWQWCSAMGDHNPSYLPGENQIAPPAMMQMWTMRDINDRCAPGSTDKLHYQVFKDMEAMGYPANVAVSYDVSFYRYLHIGEQVRHFTTIVNISEKKSTRLGVGFFVTERVEYLTQDETPFAEAVITFFQYLPAQSAVSTESPRGVPVEGGTSWLPDFEDLDIAALQIGDRLPRVVIPITHRLIVGGAMATQDFTPVHHNVTAAREAGMPDVFVNILSTCGLSARYLGDWAGVGGRLEKISFDLLTPNFPGDTMVMEGELTAITPAAAGARVAVSWGGKNGLGFHVRGKATLALPGRN